jgi:hypothetical protein
MQQLIPVGDVLEVTNWRVKRPKTGFEDGQTQQLGRVLASRDWIASAIVFGCPAFLGPFLAHEAVAHKSCKADRETRI